ncbi:hypothetical protein [Streptomyces sp. NPDC052179]|uniref:hypothetical protein n=1 Tax=Streptomyces sp. NPDC052179 TaxID=3155680 RepID=UPI003432E70B
MAALPCHRGRGRAGDLELWRQQLRHRRPGGRRADDGRRRRGGAEPAVDALSAPGGVAVVPAGAAFGAGRQDALAAGDVTADEPTEWLVGWFTPENWIIVAQVITVAGCLYALRGGWVSPRRTQGLHRLARGRRLAVAVAELTGWERAGRNRGRVVVGFHDADGAHHAFPAVVDRHALGRTAFVLYDVEHPGDATSSRVSSPRKGKR